MNLQPINELFRRFTAPVDHLTQLGGIHTDFVSELVVFLLQTRNIFFQEITECIILVQLVGFEIVLDEVF